MNAKIFINYRREDTRHAAGRLYDHLITRFGKDQVFMDIDQIEPGEDFVEVINRKVGTCDIAIVAIGPNWLRTTDASGKRRLDDPEDFVRMEIVAALQRKIRVIPVLVGGARMPRKQDLPEALAPLSRRNAIELTETRFHTDVNRLIEAIEKPLAAGKKKAELSATSVKEATTLEKSTQTTQSQPAIPPMTSMSPIAAFFSKLRAALKQRLIIVTAVGATAILLLTIIWLLKRADNPQDLREALKRYTYEYGWAGGVANESNPSKARYFRVTDFQVVGKEVRMKYDWMSGELVGEVNGHDFSGSWKQANGKGNFHLTFDSEFKEASGWWNDGGNTLKNAAFMRLTQ